ncbi:uncharacterized protein V6R79_002114 [Siganus canaliculatus]
MSDDESEEFDLGELKLDKYEGERNEKGERHGVGKAVLPNGDVYQGQYANGCRHGEGTYCFKNGSKYVGTYDQNMKHGQGIFYYPDGSKYEGSWEKDLREGYGVYTYTNGDTYDGEWLNNLRHGQGIYNYRDTGSKYKGSWVKGKMESAGEYIHSNYRYHGHFFNNQPRGLGKFVFNIRCELHGVYHQEKQDQPEPESDESDSVAKLTWVPKYITGNMTSGGEKEMLAGN